MSGDDSPRSLISRLFSREGFNPDWKARRGKSMCPSKKGKTDTPIAEDTQSPESSAASDDDKHDPVSICKPLNVPPSKSCPPREQCCYIKMQDPRAPCCRDHTTDLAPCPAKQHHPEPRDPICECDRCKKRGGRCCEKNYRRSNVDSRYFQQA